jgi:nitrate reductase gamma subunit
VLPAPKRASAEPPGQQKATSRSEGRTHAGTHEYALLVCLRLSLICFTVFLAGSLIRFDQNQYSWKSDSSQMLRTGSLRWGSNLFHVGILLLFFGHLLGLLTPHSFYGHFLEVPVKQMLAIYSGGAAGVMCFVGLTLLIHRRVFDPRIRASSHPTDIAVLVILWVQLVVGLITLPFS